MTQKADHRQVSVLVSIEGNLGVGKSSFLEWFEGDEEVTVLKEPVERWEAVGNENLLELKYVNSQRWEFTFQIYADVTRLIQLRDSQGKGKIRLQERSLLTAHKIFCALQREAGAVTEAESSVLETWFENMSQTGSQVQVVPDLFVYLRTDPKIAFQRMQKRGREAERTVSIDYLTKVHEFHEKVFITEAHLLPSPVLVLEADVKEHLMSYLWADCITRIDLLRKAKHTDAALLEEFMQELEAAGTAC